MTLLDASIVAHVPYSVRGVSNHGGVVTPQHIAPAVSNSSHKNINAVLDLKHVRAVNGTGVFLPNRVLFAEAGHFEACQGNHKGARKVFPFERFLHLLTSTSGRPIASFAFKIRDWVAVLLLAPKVGETDRLGRGPCHTC